jgi:pimeloyl-ACP methyl ester carboxylesterase
MRAKVRDLRGLELLPEAGHFVQQEQPEALNRLLLDFLATLDAPV